MKFRLIPLLEVAEREDRKILLDAICNSVLDGLDRPCTFANYTTSGEWDGDVNASGEWEDDKNTLTTHLTFSHFSKE